MKLAPANKVGFPKKPSAMEQARVQGAVLALVSFLLGVGVTAFWFHLAASRNAGNLSSGTNRAPVAEQPLTETAAANPPARPWIASPPPVDAATLAEVRQMIPNFTSVSLADGTQMLRAAALKQFAAAATEMDAQVKAAQARLVQAENGQAADTQQAAMKQLQQTQAEQTEKLQQIAARLQTQIAALKQLKGVAP